jgi:hypothetical protein
MHGSCHERLDEGSSMQPVWTAPRDGSWVRFYATRNGLTSRPVQWRTSGAFGPGWYGARGFPLASKLFDAWLPVEGAAPAWCEVLGVDRTATRAQIVAAYWERAKAAHPDFGGRREAMTALVRAPG